MIAGLLLALGSAAMINLGFLLQHRGLRRQADRRGVAAVAAALRNPVWLSGQALGWLGFGAQIVAVAIAPLALVQAFAAGGLALSVPLASGMFRQPVSRSQALAVVVIAAGLAVLPIGVPAGRDHLATTTLVGAVAVLAAAGLVAGRLHGSWARAAAAGIFYGVADAGIKAVSLGWRGHGAAAVVSGWTAVAAAGTFAGFLMFQSALRDEDPVTAISVMTALTALVALGCGLGAFGESLGAHAGTVLLHLMAIAVVVAAVPVLARAQTTLAQATTGRGRGAAGRRNPVPLASRSR